MIKRIAAYLALIISLMSVAYAEAELDLKEFQNDAIPWSAEVVAYDPVAREIDMPVYFDVIPLDCEPGDVSEKAIDFALVAEVFSDLTVELVDEKIEREENRWRFAIVYTVKLESEQTKSIRVDFYDYSDVVDISFPDKAETRYQVILKGEDSYALEDVYLNVVARLRRHTRRTRE